MTEDNVSELTRSERQREKDKTQDLHASILYRLRPKIAVCTFGW
jgi:hypothetical protein